MKKVLFIALFLCLCASAAFAQTPTPTPVAPSASAELKGIVDPSAFSGAVGVNRVWYGDHLKPGVEVQFSLARPLGHVLSVVGLATHDWTNGINRYAVGVRLRVFQNGKLFGE